MATQLLAAGTSEADSSTFTLVDGATATIMLKPAAGKVSVPLQALVRIQHQNAAGAWVHNTDLFGSVGSAVVSGAGTYRVHRPAQRFAVGVDRG